MARHHLLFRPSIFLHLSHPPSLLLSHSQGYTDLIPPPLSNDWRLQVVFAVFNFFVVYILMNLFVGVVMEALQVRLVFIFVVAVCCCRYDCRCCCCFCFVVVDVNVIPVVDIV